MSHGNIWAPWRMAYLRALKSQAPAETPPPDSTDFFRRYWLEPERDEENLVVHRNELGFLVLNRYPYANGHLLAALGEAAPTLLEYDESHRQAFWALVEDACRLVRHVLNPQGVNIGANIGDAAGAGVPEHLHAHVVPRWSGDTNFMTVVGTIRVAPDSLESVARTYREAIEAGALTPTE
jgi:ATP adenylyltransferase